MRLTQDAQVMPSIGRVSSAVVGVRHTPWEYTTSDRVRDCRDARARGAIRTTIAGPVGSVPRRGHGPGRGRGRVADDRRGVRGSLVRRLGAPVEPAARRPRPTIHAAPTSPRPSRRSRRSSPAGRPAAPSRSTWPIGRPGTGASSTPSAAIPWGATASYGEIARRIGAPRAARAVGGALGRNPIGLLIPCHRVIAADGTIGGYGGDGWGSREERLAIKRDLLLREGVTVAEHDG